MRNRYQNHETQCKMLKVLVKFSFKKTSKKFLNKTEQMSVHFSAHNMTCTSLTSIYQGMQKSE